MHYLITGGSGFIGQALSAQLLARGQAVTVLTRRPDASLRRWSPHPRLRAIARLEQLDGADAAPVDVVVNLQGENLAAGRWSAARKQVFRSSRIEATRALVGWIAARRLRPSALISASAIGWYGSRGDEALCESSTGGRDFSAQLCADWEAEALGAQNLGLRVCIARIGIVLDRDGGALAKMLPAFRLGAGGPLGAGQHWMSWITRHDLVRLLLWLAESNQAGVFNAVAPGAVRNLDFTRALGRALHRPAVLPMPAFVLRLMFGEMSSLLLGSQRVLPERALAAGFAFDHATLDAALASVFARRR